MKKCIIIGSGLGGLSCGVILARNGYHVTVLEQGEQAGGCLQSFWRHGAKFETGMHFIGSALKGQMLHPILHYLQLHNLPLSQLDTAGYDIISLPEGRFALANGHEPFVQTLTNSFPKEKDNLHRYLNVVEQMAQLASLYAPQTPSQTPLLAQIRAQYQALSIDQALDRLIGHPLLRNVLVGNLPLYAGERGRTPFYNHAFITNSYNQGAFRVAGGSDIIAQRLIQGIEQWGGRVLTQRRVARILCNNSRATGVITAQEEHFDADIIVAALHPTLTMAMLNDTSLMRPAFRQRMLNLPNTTGVFTLYLKFRPQTMPYRNHNLYGYATNSPWDSMQYTRENWPQGFLYLHLCDALAHNASHNATPQWATSAEILAPMRYEDVAQWANTNVQQRGDDYQAFKHERAERLIDAVERHAPGLRQSIECYFTSTPLTYQHYTATPEGSMYGVAKDVTLGMACHVPHRTRIPNLFFAGQNLNGHGMLGTLVGTLITCQEVLGAPSLQLQGDALMGNE